MKTLPRERNWNPLGRGEANPRHTPRQALLLLAALLLASAAINLWQTRAREQNRPMALEEIISSAALPFELSLKQGTRWLQRQWAGLGQGSRLVQERQRLEEEAARLRAENMRLTEALLRQKRLRPLLASGGERSGRALPAAVIGENYRYCLSSLLLNRGRRDGLRPRLPMVAAAGVVGQIYAVTANTARVLPLTAPESGAAALVQRTRAAGLVRGAGGELCEMRFLQAEAKVKVGDRVLTSGQGGIFPSGLLLGRVARVSRDPRTSSPVALVRPAVDFLSLEEAVVYLGE